MQEVYRHCASIVVLRESEGGYEVLLVHKPRKNDDWQLPQGGVEEEETSVEGALRELREEAGVEADVFGESAEVYTYDFPESFRRFRPDNVKGQEVHFAFAVLKPDQEIFVDGKEIDGYEWVAPGDLGRLIERESYLEVVVRVVEEAIGILAS